MSIYDQYFMMQVQSRVLSCFHFVQINSMEMYFSCMPLNEHEFYVSIYRSIKKVISLRNISKVFSHFIIHLWSMFYHTCN